MENNPIPSPEASRTQRLAPGVGPASMRTRGS